MFSYSYDKLCMPSSLTEDIEGAGFEAELSHIETWDNPHQTTIWFTSKLTPVEFAKLTVAVERHIKKIGNDYPSEVVTQYELNDKTLKLARGVCTVDENGQGTIYFKVPGEFGSGNGRYVVGGYGFTDDYNADDYVIVRVEDKDRIIAMMIAQSIDPEATEPVADEVVQGAGVIPGLGIELPDYPMIRSYTDEEADEASKGWYFWPLAQGNNLPPLGEIEVNPIGGYGFIPSGFYVKLIYQRPNGVTTGKLRANIDWGRKE